MIRFLRKEYEELQKDREFENSIKEQNGFQVTDFRNIISNSDLDNDTKVKYVSSEMELRDSGLVQNDIPPTFEEFSAAYKKQGRYAVRKQVWENFTDEQRKTYLQHSQATIYKDKHLEPLDQDSTRKLAEKIIVDLEVNKEEYIPFFKSDSKVPEND